MLLNVHGVGFIYSYREINCRAKERVRVQNDVTAGTAWKIERGLKLNINDFENFVFAANFQSSNDITEKLAMLLATRSNLADAERINFLIFLSTGTEIFLPTVEEMFDFDGFSGGTLQFP